jgi:hypothetical protein
LSTVEKDVCLSFEWHFAKSWQIKFFIGYQNSPIWSAVAFFIFYLMAQYDQAFCFSDMDGRYGKADSRIRVNGP